MLRRLRHCDETFPHGHSSAKISSYCYGQAITLLTGPGGSAADKAGLAKRVKCFTLISLASPGANQSFHMRIRENNPVSRCPEGNWRDAFRIALWKLMFLAKTAQDGKKGRFGRISTYTMIPSFKISPPHLRVPAVAFRPQIGDRSAILVPKHHLIQQRLFADRESGTGFSISLHRFHPSRRTSWPTLNPAARPPNIEKIPCCGGLRPCSSPIFRRTGRTPRP